MLVSSSAALRRALASSAELARGCAFYAALGLVELPLSSTHCGHGRHFQRWSAQTLMLPCDHACSFSANLARLDAGSFPCQIRRLFDVFASPDVLT